MRRRGSSMIEFALGLLVLAPVVAGLLRWTAGSYLIFEMREAVRRGAIYAAAQPGGRYAELDSDVERRVRNVVLCGSASTCEMARVAGLRAENVHVSFAPAAGIVTVSIAGYEGPGGILKLPKGPSASMPYGARGGA